VIQAFLDIVARTVGGRGGGADFVRVVENHPPAVVFRQQAAAEGHEAPAIGIAAIPSQQRSARPIGLVRGAALRHVLHPLPQGVIGVHGNQAAIRVQVYSRQVPLGIPLIGVGAAVLQVARQVVLIIGIHASRGYIIYLVVVAGTVGGSQALGLAPAGGAAHVAINIIAERLIVPYGAGRA